MATPFKKVISDFSGGQVDFFSTRDLADNTYQEVTNAELRLSGTVKRPESFNQISASSGNSHYNISENAGSGFSLLHSEFGFGDGLYLSASVNTIAGLSASNSDLRIRDAALGQDISLVLSASINVVKGDFVEIYRDGVSVAEEDNIVGFYKVIDVASDTNIYVEMPNFEIEGKPITSAHTLTSNRYKIRNAHSYSPNVFGVMPCKIGKSTNNRVYSETQNAPVAEENAIMLVGLANADKTSALTIETGTPGYGFYFKPASYFKGILPDASHLHFDHLVWVGGDFTSIGINVGQTVTYTSTDTTNHDISNHNYTGVVLNIDTDMLRLSTIDTVVDTSTSVYGGTLTIADNTFLDAKLEGWTGLSATDVNTYNIAGAIRLADGNFDNAEHKNKWFGFIKTSKFGNDIDYSRAPRGLASKPLQSETPYQWVMENQEVAPPTLIKMDGWGDPTHKVKNAGEIGLYIYDPKHFSSNERMFQEHVLYPETLTRQMFDPNDRWATTFIYDGSSESELSRNSNNQIGVSGFEVVTPPVTEESAVTYLDASEEEIFAKIVGYEDENASPVDSRENGLIRISCLTDGSSGAHQKLNVGDYIKAGSETMCILAMENHTGSNGYTVYKVHRGVAGSSPIDLLPTSGGSGDDGLDVYYVNQNQSARAINVVLNTNGNTAARLDIQQSGATKFYVEAHKSLGSLANMRMDFRIVYSTTGSGSGTPSTIDVDGEKGGLQEEQMMRFVVTIVKQGTNAVAIEDVVAAINGEDPVSSNVTITQTKPANGYFTAYVENGITASDEWSAAYSVKYFGDTTIGNSVDGITANGLNKRITGFNLYWKPKNEVDYYLVNYFDIEKGWSNT